MPSISDIIKNKTTRDQARTEQRQMERENLSAMRDGSLSLITSSPEHYRQYLDLQADNIHCSVGNVALTMAQLQGATRIGTTVRQVGRPANRGLQRHRHPGRGPGLAGGGGGVRLQDRHGRGQRGRGRPHP